MKHLYLTVLALFFLACNQGNGNKQTLKANTEIKDNSISGKTPNILFLIADDMGKEAISGFQEGTIKPKTPHIDNIRNSGLSFSNFWTYPTCSPTRASMITGKYGYRTNVRWANQILSPSELILQKYINNKTKNKYATALVGKWHLSGLDATSINPESFGLDYYAGIFKGSVKDYYNWLLMENGMNKTCTEYTTTKLTSLATDWIEQQEKPWFMWLAYNAPHTPFHVPPSEMHSQDNLPEYNSELNPIPYFMASIEAMDYQIGRLLNSLSEADKENTIIIFIGDNGTEPAVTQAPYGKNQVKRNLYQGGINMPMFISGKGVTRKGIDNNLITSSDMFATISEIAGVDIPEINDSKSFKSLFTKEDVIRTYQYSEMKNDTKDAWTISNGTYKLMVFGNGNKEIYNLNNDPYEKNNLIKATLTPSLQQVKTELEQELLKIRN
ncbi:sulfatase-like hydrolase/transferase [Algibacter sp. L4_22]|uniref:sulfatase-like hydrolase/transferase n=1 Tax=Algibacter sp. L4_22 TaxID=2942477 RepID=UPI00201B4DE5|nr:sulfatase-like hydrolase/transferase [Algibacter sp. L4_22]MCL5128906.1 sulfatase-like hydrolase/transferase [Algibacter sp. L4_22]